MASADLASRFDMPMGRETVISMRRQRLVAGFAIMLCLACGLGLWAHAASAQELRIGVLQHDTEIGQQRTEPGTDINLEWVGPVYSLPPAMQLYPGFGLHPEVGYSGNFGGARTEEIYAAMGFDLLPGKSWELRVSLGLAAHNGQLDRDDKNRLALGQRVLLYASFEAGYWWHDNGLFVFFQHSSNGPMGGPNDGINNLGVRYGYRF